MKSKEMYQKGLLFVIHSSSCTAWYEGESMRRITVIEENHGEKTILM
jgi:hypothetical protein